MMFIKGDGEIKVMQLNQDFVMKIMSKIKKLTTCNISQNRKI